MNTTLQPIEELENLSEDQRDQLRDWLTELSIRKTMAKLRGEWSIIITYNKLQRYRQRLLAKDQVSEHLDHKMAMAEFLNLLNGNPVPYDEAGLALIQKRAFEAACAPKIAVSSLATLQRIFNYKNARSDIEHKKQIADRNTAVREAKLALDRARSPSPLGGDHNSRSERLVEGNTLVAGSGSHWAGVRGVPASDSVPCDHLGPLARTWEDVRRRAQIKFGITPEESARRAELRRIRRNSNSESASAPNLTNRNLNPPSQPLNIIDLLKDLAKTDDSCAAPADLHQTQNSALSTQNLESRPTSISRETTPNTDSISTEQSRPENRTPLPSVTANPNPEHPVNPVEDPSSLPSLPSVNDPSALNPNQLTP